jgi:predicted RNA binding protein YcfA (HicA-like mRNA interferase family)
MKRIDLVRKLEGEGCLLIRHGGGHDWYQNPKTGACQPVPRHREVSEFLAKHILKKLSVNPE